MSSMIAVVNVGRTNGMTKVGRWKSFANFGNIFWKYLQSQKKVSNV